MSVDRYRFLVSRSGVLLQEGPFCVSLQVGWVARKRKVQHLLVSNVSMYALSGFLARRLEAIPTRWEAIACRLDAIAIRFPC